MLRFWEQLKDGRKASGVTQGYNFCLLNGLLVYHKNFLVAHSGLTFPKDEVRTVDYLHGEEPDRLLEASLDCGVYAHSMVSAELTLGLRRSECLRWRLEHIFEEAERLPPNPSAEEILRLKVRDEAKVIGKGKHRPKPRWVPISDHFRALLPDLVRERERQIVGHLGKDTGYLFAHVADRHTKDNLGESIPKGHVGPWSADYADLHWMRPAFRAAGIYRPGNLHHALRRTFGRALWFAGKTLEEIAVLMGHTSSLVTLRHYLRLDADDRMRAAAPINKRFPPRTPAAAREAA